MTRNALVLLSCVYIFAGCARVRALFGCERSDMKPLAIEWRHLVVDGNTCLRCGETGRSLDSVVADLREELAPRGVEVSFRDVPLEPDRLAESNTILFNDVPIESVLPGLKVTYTSCQSCCGMVGKPVECRAVEYEGATYDEVPEAAIRAAALRAAGLEPSGQ